MIDPWLSKPREGVRIRVKDRVRLNHELPSAQMPPYIGIGHVPRRHSEKTQRKDNNEYSTGLQK
jgi:hypothetical protein